MNENIRLILERTKLIEGLKKILKDMDPASGVAVAVRRGVARDNEAIEYDNELRPWHTVELSNLGGAEAIINVLIIELEASIKLRRSYLSSELAEIQAFLANQSSSEKAK
jgi:hypothetical protein